MESKRIRMVGSMRAQNLLDAPAIISSPCDIMVESKRFKARAVPTKHCSSWHRLPSACAKYFLYDNT